MRQVRILIWVCLACLCNLSVARAEWFVRINRLSDLDPNDDIVLAIQNGKNIYTWYALNTDTTPYANTQTIIVQDSVLYNTDSTIVWQMKSNAPYQFTHSDTIFPLQNIYGWSIKSIAGKNRFLFTTASAGKDTIIWRSNKSGHCLDWFGADPTDYMVYDQVAQKKTLSTGAYALSIFKRRFGASFRTNDYGRIDRDDTLKVADCHDDWLVCPVCYENSSRHPFLGWAESEDGVVVHQPGDTVVLTEDKIYYAVFGTIVVPSQCFDYTDLHADFVTCRWGTVARYPETTIFNPDSLTHVGVMEGDDLSSYDVHINVIDDPNSICALLADTIHEVPPGFQNSVRLGNYQKGVSLEYSFCEDVEYTLTIDTIDSPILLMKYLPVLEDSHAGGSGIRLDIYDEYGQRIDSACSSFDFTLEGKEITGTMPGNPEWKTSRRNPNYTAYEGNEFRYHDWATIGLDLSAYQGQTVVIKLMLHDCLWTGHLGFVYYAFMCQPKKLSVYSCGAGDQVQLAAPDGFFYRWYAESTPGEYFSTQRVTDLPDGTTDSVFYCDLSPKADFSCYFPVNITVGPRHPVAKFDYEIHRGFCADTLFVNNVSYASPDGIAEFPVHEDCDAAKWNFGGGKTIENTTPNPNAYFQVDPIIYTKSGDYTVSLKTCLESWDCAVDETSITFHVSAGDDYQIFYDTICLGESFTFMGNKLTPTRSGDHTYVQQVTDVGCLSQVTVEQRLHVRSKYEIWEYDSVCPRDSFIWHGRVLKMPGIYYDSLTTETGGCDSVHILDLYYFPEVPDSTTFREVICEESAYWWNGTRYTESGLYTQTLQNQYGCDSVVTLDLYVRPRYGKEFLPPNYWDNPYLYNTPEPGSWADPFMTDSTDTEDFPINDPGAWADPYMDAPLTIDTICEGEVYMWHGHGYTQTGVYNDTLYTIYGCDSIVQLALLVCPRYQFYEQHVIWAGEQYQWMGHLDNIILSEAGTYYDSLTTASCQCDSVYVLDLIVNTHDEVTVIDTVCEGYGKPWHYGLTDTIYYNEGTYTDTLTSSVGLDSVVHLILYITPTTYGDTLNATICENDSILWRERYYHTPGLYTDTLSNACECDSIIFLNLQSFFNDTIITIDTICEGQEYKWEGNTYTTSTQDTIKYTNQHGCDSLSILDLTVLPTVHSYQESVICNGDSIFFFGHYIKDAGEYTMRLTSMVTFCDSIIHLTLYHKPTWRFDIYDTICTGEIYHWEDSIYMHPGIYNKHFNSQDGCDSVRYLHLYVARKYQVDIDTTLDFWQDPYGAVVKYKDDPTSWMDPYPTILKPDTFYWKHPYWQTFYSEDSICELTDTIHWHGLNLTKAGLYTDTLLSVARCDSVVYLRLWAKECTCNIDSSVIDTTFAYDSLQLHPFQWFGHSYSEPGVYEDTLIAGNAQGCDSIGRLLLRVTYKDSALVCNDDLFTFHTPWGDYTTTDGCDCLTGCIQKTADDECVVDISLCVTRLITDTLKSDTTLCWGSSTIWHGQIIDHSGLYSDTLHFEREGAPICDSLIYLMQATVKPEPQHYPTSITLCEGMTYTWTTYHDSTITAAGIYYDTLWTDHGCYSDSYELTLLYSDHSASDTTAYVCYGDMPYLWHGKTLTKACDTTWTTTNTSGCDSIVTLHLLVSPQPVEQNKDTAICDGSSYTWHEQIITSAGTYYDTTKVQTAGMTMCDSIWHKLTLSILYPTDSVTNATICEGESFEWYGHIYATPKDTSITLINAAGCDSVCSLHLSVNPKHSEEIYLTICDKQLPYSWKNQTCTVVGIYVFDTLTVQGCDSTLTLHLSVDIFSASDTTAYVCYGDMPYLWHGKTLTKACDTTWITTNTSGCDSIVTLHLLVSPQPVEQNKDTAICDGSSYTWHEQIITSAGTYYDTTKVQTAGMTMCDSIWHKLTVSLRQPSTSDVYDTICYNQTYTWNGIEYKNKKESFTDQITLENAAGCDSIVTLHVLVTAKPQSIIIDTTLCQGSSFEWYGNHVDHASTYFGFVSSKIKPDCDSLYLNFKVTMKEPTASDTTATACGSFTWYGNTYTASGDYTWTTDNAVGCDSVRTLHLTINQSTTGDTTATACSSFTWHGTEYTTSAEPTWTYTNAASCDSVVTLHLTINQPTTGDTTATACSSFTWHGIEYTSSAEPTWTYTNAAGCDSVVTLHLTINKPSTSETTVQICHDELPYRWNGEDYSAAGDYPYHTLNAVGCDSTATLHLNVIYCCPDTIMQQQTISMCDTLMPYTWNTWRENILSETGFFTDTLRNERGCDSIIYTLTLDTFHCCAPLMADIHIDDICADATTLPVMLNLTGGEINEYTVHFTNPALNTMPLRDTTIRIETVYAGNEPIQLDIPIPNDPSDRTRYPRPDDSYTMDLTVRDICGHSQMWTGMPFTIFYPSWITDQHWNDVIALFNDRYNGGYTFSHVEWLQNGEVMPGQDGLYIYLPHELWTNNMHQHEDFYYQVRLTREDDGKTILTCPMWPEWRDSTNVLSDPYVSVYPTLVHKENPVVQILTNTTGTYWLYAADGKLIREADYEPCEHNAFDVAVPPIQAMYLFVFTPRGSDHPLRDKYRVVKIIVE